MELFDYMIIGTGVLLIVMGWLCYRFPNMINPYGSMSDERKALVDIEGLKRATAIILTIMGLLIITADVLHIFNVIDVEVASWLFSGSILVMIVPIIIAMKKYNGFGRDKTGEGVYGPRLEKAPKIVLVTLGLAMAFIAVIIAMSSRPQQIKVGEDSVKISGMYGREIPVADIVSVELVEALPHVKMRTNGSSTGRYSKGHFLLEDDEKCMLFVRHKMPPYIEIRTTEGGLYYLNCDTKEETLEMFSKLKETIDVKTITGNYGNRPLYRHGGQGSAISCAKRIILAFGRLRIESAMTAGQARNDGFGVGFVPRPEVASPVSKKEAE